jgi:hypothetical protein
VSPNSCAFTTFGMALVDFMMSCAKNLAPIPGQGVSFQLFLEHRPRIF